MAHPNVDLVQRLYAGYMSGDQETLLASLDPEVRWHNSGFDDTAGTYEGIDAVLGYLFADNHMDDYRLDVVDVLASDSRVAVIARTSGRRGDQRLSNDFVQILRVDDGRVREVWNYYWDQRAIAEFMAIPA